MTRKTTFYTCKSGPLMHHTLRDLVGAPPIACKMFCLLHSEPWREAPWYSVDVAGSKLDISYGSAHRALKWLMDADIIQSKKMIPENGTKARHSV